MEGAREKQYIKTLVLQRFCPHPCPIPYSELEIWTDVDLYQTDFSNKGSPWCSDPS